MQLLGEYDQAIAANRKASELDELGIAFEAAELENPDSESQPHSYPTLNSDLI